MLRLGLFVVLALCATLSVHSTSGTAASPTNFATGSLIIPMDTDTTANHASYNQNNGMWKAYGLVFKLLQSGIPVQWAISSTKTTTSDIDVSISSVKDKRTGTSLGNWDYRGGPFIIDSAYAAQALPIITAWWSANSNEPNVHEAQASFQATIPTILTSAPLIANEAINIGVTSAYYNAAGIPDANGNPWSSTSPNVLDETQIANGALFTQGAACQQPKYSIFVTPHNSGYAYSLSDPLNLGTETYAQLDTFVQEGGGWTALCHSVLSNENAIAALTTNGTASVKALFKTSQPGGVPGGFLTTNGFPSIDNTGGTWSVLAPGLPTAQGVPTAVANGLPGGSVQTWPAPGNAGAPTYYANTTRVATFTASGVSHDNIITGIYHNGTGAGRVTYIGGHSFGTALPYSTNAEAPYLRAFFNSLLFNGSGTAKLDLVPSSSSYPENGTGLLTVSIKNTGGSTARSIGNAGITLASGFTYAGTVSGPAPTVSGQTLVWPGGLGDVAGGASPVTFQVSVDPSVSASAGSVHLGTLSATFSDDFGGTFTAGVCKDVTISPVPAPSLTMTPASQGPVNPGEPVTWTLTYGDTGGAALQSGIVQDTLPPGFVYVSSSASPSLGVPKVIPGAQTIVRWNAGTVAANTASAGTITITARAGAITAGTGSPPLQTFTNNATLTGSDASANTYSAAASATVDDQALDISLGKTVNNAFLSALPGSATYTMTPRTSDNSPLSGVRVIDPLPAGIVATPTVGQGGSYGAYSPIAAVGGDDGAGATTAITVSSNVVTTGAALTVTLNVKDTSAIPGVSPDAMTATGGDFTCGSPSPASGNVPAGGAGINFTFSCTTNGLGEYVFSDDATDGGANDWPAATSASVLSVAGGGSNVALWNLGSNTNAVPGSTVTSGYTSGVYGLRGATTTFQKFDTSQSSWTGEAATAATVGAGGSLTTDGAGTVYALGGNTTQAFYAYTAATNTWATKASTGTNVGTGGAAVFLNVGGTKYVFAAMGNNTKTFKRYDVAGNSWTAMTNSPASVKGGGSLSTDGTNIYLVPGNNAKTFYRYNVGANTWTTLASSPSAVNTGGASTYLGGYVYVLRGNRTTTFMRYSVAGNTWSTMAAAPASVTTGGALATDGTNLYALQGGSTAFWRYNVAANTWTTQPSFTAAAGAGAALVYMTGVTPQGRFTSLDVTRSLGVTGDTVDVTLSVTSSASVSSIGAGTLTVTPTNGASCSTLTGPTLTSADSTSSGTNDPVTYKWTCTLAGGASPGSLTFADSTVAGSGPVSFPAATSMSVLVSPPLTMQVTVPNGAPNPLQDTSLLLSDQATAASPTVSTWSGPPAFTLTKTTSPSSTTTLHPGDPITYTMTVQNTGSGNATNVTVSDPMPTQTNYVSCSGGTSCANAAGTVTWSVGPLAPGDSSTVTLTVSTRTDLPVSDTDYTVSNTASVTSTEVGTPTSSNTVTNDLQVKPNVVKFASTGNAGNGDPITYTVQVSNPGAAFTADVTDPVPAGTSFAGTGTCTPACSFGAGTVTWSEATIQPGTNTFTFDVAITATGGATVTNVASVDATSPNLAPIASNSVDTEVGPSLELVKLGDKTGLVAKDDVITYTLVVANESQVAASGATVTDPLPSGTTYVAGSCTTPDGTTCGFSSGDVTWSLGGVGGNASVFLSFQLKVGVGTTQVSNVAEVAATNSPTPVESNYVDNGITMYPLTATIGVGQGTVTTNTGGISCTDVGGTCSASYGSGTIVTLTAAGRNGQQFTGWSGDCSGSSPSCQVTMGQAHNVTASFATPPAIPDLVLTKTHVGDFAQHETGSYTLTASNIGGTPTSGTVTVVDTIPTGLTVTAMSGTGWSCIVGTATCTRSDALSAGSSYPTITVTVAVAPNAGASVTNQAAISGGGETNTANDTASDLTTIDPVVTWALNASVTGSGSVGADSGALSGCISSGGVCSDVYEDGTVVTLTEAPAAHYSFTGWGGACAGAATTCQVTMTQARTVTAAFAVYQPDLTIVKSHVGNFTQGGTGTYTLLVSNLGADPSYGAVSVSDNPPVGLTVTGLAGTGWTCDVPTATCTRSDPLAAGASYPAITATVSVAGNAGSPLTNTVTVSGGGDVNGANNASSDPTTITTQIFPLNVTIGAGQGGVTSDTGGVNCTDAGGTCSAGYTNGTVVTLTETSSAHYSFSGWGGACTGTATTCHVTMSQVRNVSASFALFQPDLTVVKSHVGNFTQGGTGTYSVVVSNVGADPSYGAVETVDNPPVGLTVTAMSGTGWTCDVPTASCTRSDALAASASYPTITVTIAVDGDAAASISNHVTVTGGGDVNAADNTSSDPTTIVPQQFALGVSVTGSGSVGADTGAVSGCTSSGGVCSDSYDNGTVVTLTATPAAHTNFTGWGGACSGTASCVVTMSQARTVTAAFTVFQPDLTIAKSHTGNFTQGATGTYSLLVSNLGADPSYGTVTVADTAPATLTVTGIAGTGWTCDIPTATCTRADALAAGASYPAITVTVSVDGDAAASATNQASVSGGGDVDLTDNSASDPTTIVAQQFLLTVAIGAGQGTLTTDSGGVNCTDAGGTCSASYDNGTSVTLTAAGRNGEQFTGWSGDCSGASTSCQVTMSQARNVTASFATPPAAPDLVLTKTHVGDFTQGGTGSYTVTASNAGGTPTIGTVTVVDTAPSGLTVTAIAGTGWTCDVPTATCTRSDALAAGSSYPAITVSVSVASNAAASVTNQATASGGGETVIGNDTASDLTTILPHQTWQLTVSVTGSGSVGADSGAIAGCTSSGGVCSDVYDDGTLVTLTAAPAADFTFTGWGGDCTGSATTCQVTMSQARNVIATFTVYQPDLTIAKTHTGNFTQGGTGTYTLTVSNAGPDPSYGTVTVLDTPPAGLTITGLAGTGWSCVVAAATCSRSDAVASSASFPAITVTVAVDGNAATSLTNSATVSGGGDVNGANNGASDPTTIDPQQFPLTVIVTGSGTVGAGSGAVSGCTSSGGVCNGNYDNGTLVTLTATPGTHYSFNGWSGACSGSGTCEVTMDQVRNVAALFSMFQPDLAIAKSHTGSFNQGGTGTYALHVSNVGTDPSFGVVTVSDNPPVGLTVTALTGTGWACDVPTATCTRSDALAGAASYPAITVTVAVAGDAATSLTNSASVSGGGDVNGANNTATDPTTVVLQQFPLTVLVSGSGSVDANVGLVSGCTSSGGVCTDSYDNGTVVTLTATPATNFSFSGWGGACSSGTTTCHVTMSGLRNVTATFGTFQPDLTIAKSHTGSFNQGGTGTYTLLVSNLAADPTFGTVTVVDTPPAALTVTGMSGTGWTCDVPTASCARSDVLAGGASYPAITVTVAVDGNAGASVTNTAAVSGGGDQSSGNDTASDPTTVVVQQFPLTVSVTGSGSVGANTGAVSACTSSGGVCSDSYGNGTVVTLTATPAVHANFTGWTGACSGIATCQVTMSQARNVTATFTIFQPDLTISKSHSGNFTQAGTGTYTVTVTNTGTDSSYGTVTVADTTPAGLTVTGISGTGWTCDVPTATCTRSDALAPGASYPVITVTVAVDGNAAASLTNSATVAGGGDVNGANNTAADSTTIVPQQFALGVSVTGSGSVGANTGAISSCTSSGGVCADSYDNGTVVTLTATAAAHTNFTGWGGACSGAATTCQVTMSQARTVTAGFTIYQPDLTIAKNHSGNFTQGGTGTYSILVSNLGADPSYGTVTVADTAPAALTVTGIAGTGWTCDTPTATCTRADALAAGVTYPAITVTVSVATNAPSSATNSATVSGGGDVNGTNNSASDPTTIMTQQFPLTVSVSGAGTVDANSGAISGCASSAGVCSDAFGNGAVVTLTATTGAHSSFAGWGGACTGAATTCQVTMSQARNVTATFTGFRPDLTLAKSHVGTFTQGGTGSYALLVSNLGSDPSYGQVTVVESPPASLTVTGMSGNGWSCDVAAATCTRSDALAAGASYPAIAVTVAVDGNAPTSATNSATVSGGGDVDGSNNSASDPTVIAKQQFPLTVSVTGFGSAGTSGGAICNASGGACSGTYDNGTVVTLTATPGPSATFDGWSGDCTGTATTCQVTMSQARNVTATFEPTDVSAAPHVQSAHSSTPATHLSCTATKTCPHPRRRPVIKMQALRVELDGTGTGRVESAPSGVRCGQDCRQTYAAGKLVTLVATAGKRSVLSSFAGCDTIDGRRCMVRMDRARNVVASFAPAATVTLEVPSRLVYHWPYDSAAVTAHATFDGHPVSGIPVTATVTCPGQQPSVHLAATDASGNISFTEARHMVNAVRLLDCTASATATIAGYEARGSAHVRFIHPYWLKVLSEHADGSHVVIAAFARPGAFFDVCVNAKVIRRVTVGASFWVDIPLPTARPGDIVELDGIGNHRFSHAISLGLTPKTEIVH
jgi:uncharacterized repeat protein (TIGR01451 family)